jgi:hypothetical protein
MEESMRRSIRTILGLAMASVLFVGVIGATRDYSATIKMFFLGSVQSGALASASGGSLAAEPITIRFGLNMSKGLYDWIILTMRGEAPRLKGAIVTCSSSLIPSSTQTFVDAVITEANFPALDTASGDQVLLTVRFQPESDVTAQGSTLKPTAISTVAQKAWLASNFRVSIEGLPSAKVSRVESFSLKHSGGAVTYSNVVVLVPAADAAPWIDWRQQFVKAGTNTLTLEKKGQISWLAPDLKTALGSVTLSGLGITKLEEVAGADGVTRYRATMSCRSMALSVVP